MVRSCIGGREKCSHREVGRNVPVTLDFRGSDKLAVCLSLTPSPLPSITSRSSPCSDRQRLAQRDREEAQEEDHESDYLYSSQALTQYDGGPADRYYGVGTGQGSYQQCGTGSHG